MLRIDPKQGDKKGRVGYSCAQLASLLAIARAKRDGGRRSRPPTALGYYTYK